MQHAGLSLERASCVVMAEAQLHGGQCALPPSRSGSMSSTQTLLAAPGGQNGGRASESPCAPARQAATPMPAHIDFSGDEPAAGIDIGLPARPAAAASVETGAAPYEAYREMMSRHKLRELQTWQQTQRLAAGEVIDDGSRKVVVSWLVEVAEDFGLAQETLHAAVALLDRFLAMSAQAVPRCVLQLVAVACTFVAAKQLEVHHPRVEQMVAVAAHSFTTGDLLRMERVLLDALGFSITSPTAYTFLHLLTQASMTAGDVTGSLAVPSPPLEMVVSLAMFLAELALLDLSCLGLRSSHVATAAMLLAHATLAHGDTRAWPAVLAAAGLAAQDVAPALAVLGCLHAAACHPASSQLAELLAPLRTKFSADAWCRVSQDVSPLVLQQYSYGAC